MRQLPIEGDVYGMLSTMRGFCDYLVRQGLWKINPLRWMKGPKVTAYSRLPKRVEEALSASGSASRWRLQLASVGNDPGDVVRHGLADGRKTGQQRCVPLPEMVLRCLEAHLPLRHNQLEQVGLIQERPAYVYSSRAPHL